MAIKKLILILLCLPLFSFGQTLEEISNATGIQKAQLSLQYSSKKIKDAPGEVIDLCLDAYNIGVSSANDKIIGLSGMLLSKAYYDTGKFSEATKFGEIAKKKIIPTDPNYVGVVSVLGSAYSKTGEVDKMVLNLKESLEIKPSGNKALELATGLTKAKKHLDAIVYYDKAIELFTTAEGKNSNNVINAEINKGLSLSNYGDYKGALAHFNIVLSKYTLSDAKSSEISGYLTTIEGNIKAKESGVTEYDKQGTGSTTGEKGSDNTSASDVKIADLQKKIASLNAKSLSEIEKLSASMQLAELKIKAQSDYYTQELLNEKLLQAETQKQLNAEKAAKDLAESEKAVIYAKSQISEAESEAKTLWIYLLMVVMAIVIVLGSFIYIGYKRKKQFNTELMLQNEIILASNEQITRQNENIKKSLDYALKIQTAILPNPDRFFEVVPNSFVMLKPKDMVSGDFFFYHIISKNKFIVAAADCTGHGVPGALMSIICNQVLDKVVVEDKIYRPDRILEETVIEFSRRITENHYTYDNFKDGMDVSVALIDLDKNVLEFSGARNPVYVVRNSKAIEIPATRRSISLMDDVRFNPPFELHKIDLLANDHIYLFSDGYADQKGGPNKKKFYYEPFKDLLSTLSSNNNIDIQPDILDKKLQEWKGDFEQIDDILIVGVEVEDINETYV